MPSAKALYSSGRWLNASDIVDKVGMNKRITAVITHVEPALVGQDQKNQLVLDLASRQGQPWPKKLTLNNTRNMAMISAFDDDYSQWTGKVIEVWAELTLFAGKMVPGIKCGPATNGNGTPPAPQQPQRPPPSASAVAGIPANASPSWNPPGKSSIDDDEIPF